MISTLLIILNIFGMVCLVYFAIPYCTHNTYVADPDAMLPVEAWDSSGIILTIGLIPMLLTNTAGFLFVFKKGSPILLRLLFFIPAITEIIIVLHYWITSFA